MNERQEASRDEAMDRREALALMAAAGGASLLIPTRWTAPVIDLVTLPAHAALSGTGPGTGTGNGGPGTGTGNGGTGTGTGNGGTGTGTGSGYGTYTVDVGGDNRVTLQFDSATCRFELFSGDNGAPDAIVVQWQPGETYAQAALRGVLTCMGASGWDMTSCYSTQIYGIGYGFDITVLVEDDAGNQVEVVFNMEANGTTTLVDQNASTCN